MYPRTGQRCQGRDPAYDPRSWRTGFSVPTYSKVHNTDVRPCLSHCTPPLFRRESTLAKGGLEAVIWRMTMLWNRVSIYRTWTRQLLSCLYPLLITVVVSKHWYWVNTRPAKMRIWLSLHADGLSRSSFGIPNLFSTHMWHVDTRNGSTLLSWLCWTPQAVKCITFRESVGRARLGYHAELTKLT